MVNEQKNDISFSDSVEEIMGTPPRRLVRWGTSLIFVVFVLLIVLSFVINYPDLIKSNIEITTKVPPVTLVSKITGNIERLYVGEKDTVRKDQILAAMETTASVEDVLMLRTLVDSVSLPEKIMAVDLPLFSELGELQGIYSLFIKNLRAINNFDLNDLYGNKIISLNVEIEGLNKYVNSLTVKENLISERLRIENRKYKRDSLLFASATLAESVIESSRQTLLQIKVDRENVRLEHSAKEIEISEKRQLLQDYRINKNEEREKLVSVVRESFQNLQAELRIWEELYLLISPIDGTVSFTRYWNVNQSVVRDEPVLNVISSNPGELLGRIYLGMYRSGKVKPTQTVNIKLSAYPYMEYGMVRGIVKSKSMVPADDSYVIEVTLPNGLKTLYGNQLEFNQKMQGTAEIITEDLTVFQKVINPFRYIATRNRK